MENYQFIGNVTRDPESKQVNTRDGAVTVCTFTVAVNGRRKATTEQNDAKFIRVTAWRKLGEICQKYVHKSDKVYVTGTVSTKAYINKEGQAVSNIDVNAQDVEFLSTKSSLKSSPYVPSEPENATTQAASFTPVEAPDNLPF